MAIKCVEPFTAVAECPQCGSIAVHPFRMPRPRPANYEPGVIRKLTDGTRIYTWGMADKFAVEESAEVMRQCRCGHEWPNK